MHKGFKSIKDYIFSRYCSEISEYYNYKKGIDNNSGNICIFSNDNIYYVSANEYIEFITVYGNNIIISDNPYQTILYGKNNLVFNQHSIYYNKNIFFFIEKQNLEITY